ncbi:zinc fingers and homeoboxes protein 1-like [Neosynchiropus ocellatus]
MASRRKSSTPCMVLPPRDAPPEGEAEDEGMQVSHSSEAELKRFVEVSTAEGGYECKYCSFRTSDLNLFTTHVDAEHPDIVINTSYVCVQCDFHTKSYDALQAHNNRLHPGKENFTRTMVKRNNETVFQQTVPELAPDGGLVKLEEDDGDDASSRGIALSKTPIMRTKSRLEVKRFGGSHNLEADDVIKLESDEENEENMEPLSPALLATPPPATPPVQAAPPGLVVNSANILQVKGGAGGVLSPGTLAQVLSALQQQQSSTQTQLLIPVSSIPTYNSAMDNNVLLVSAYNRFPYPSVSEILGLSSQTKFSEEQIKVWFSAQRLKHGVSWTPEEVEEARKKKCNGAVQQSAATTITVIPANMASPNGNSLPSIFQTCQIVGQPGLVLTQVPSNAGGSVPIASPITLAVANVPGNVPKAAEPLPAESKMEVSATAPLSFDALLKPKKSKEQLAVLKASYSRRQFATDAEISRLMQVTKLSKRAIKKWFSDTRYNQRNAKDHHQGAPLSASPSGRRGRSPCGPFNENSAPGTIIIDSSDDASDTSPSGSAAAPGAPRVKVRHAFPDFTPQRFKEKTAEQLMILEASYRQCDTPLDEELSRLRVATKLTRRELDAWFTERRKVSQHGGMEVDGESPKTVGSQNSKKIPKKTAEQLHVLKKAFVRSQWPTAEEYDKLAEDSGLQRSDIVNWFGDTRYACKNSSLKWYYLYQSGKIDEALNGGGRVQKKARKRFRGWSRRTRRPNPNKGSPQGGAPPIKVKSGRDFLKDYYLKHGSLSEKDLDDLVAKSNMGYEQVRDWFKQTQQRAEEGKELFSDQELEEEHEGMEEQEEQEEEEEDEEEEEEEEREEQEQEQDEEEQSAAEDPAPSESEEAMEEEEEEEEET